MNRRAVVYLALGLACGAGVLGSLRFQKLEDERLQREAEAEAAAQQNYVDPIVAHQRQVASQGQQLQQQTLNLFQQIIGSLQGENDPNEVFDEPEAPFTSDKRVAYAFFVLTREQAAAALAQEDPNGDRRVRLVASGLYRRLSRPGASASFVVKVDGMSDPGPGLNAMLGGSGMEPSFPPLYGAPEYYSSSDAKDRLEALDHSLKEIGGAEQVAQRAVLWRTKYLDPEASEALGEVPPPGEALTKAQLRACKSIGFAAERHLVDSLHQALEQAVHENKVLLAMKVVG